MRLPLFLLVCTALLIPADNLSAQQFGQPSAFGVGGNLAGGSTLAPIQATPPVYLGPTSPGGTYGGPLSAGIYQSTPASNVIIPGTQVLQSSSSIFLGPTGRAPTPVIPLGTTQSGTTTPGSTNASGVAGTSAFTGTAIQQQPTIPIDDGP